jgi:hypothetical protein
MSELLSLFPVLFLVYLLQCIAAAPPASVVFFLNHRLRGRILRHSWKVGRSQHRLYLLNPFWPPTGALYVDPFPLQVQRDARGEFLGLQSVSLAPSESPVNLLSFDVPCKIVCRDNQVLIDGQPWLSLRSEMIAKNVATVLAKLQKSPQRKRSSVLEGELRKMFSVDSVKDRLQQYSRSADSLHAACFSLFLFLFYLAPLLIYFLGLRHLWIGLLLYLMFSSCLILWLFRRSYRELYPAASGGHWQQMLTVALSPFAAIRANDALLTNLLSGFHPLAVASFILPETEFLEFAGVELRKAKFLSGDATLLQVLTEFLARQKVDVESLLGPPHPENLHSLSFCPVCLTQYVIDAGVCKDCDNVPLHAFAAKVPYAD